MNTQETVNEWLKLLSAEIGVAMELDSDGDCVFETETGLSCSILVPSEGDIFYLYSAIAPLPEDSEEREVAYQQALIYNMYSAARKNGSLGLDPETQELALSYAASVNGVKAEEFHAILDEFIIAAVELEQQFAQATTVS